MSIDKFAKARRYQKIAKKVPQREDGGRPWPALIDKYAEELRKEHTDADLDKWFKQRAQNDLNSLMRIGETEAFGIISIEPVFNIEYYPLLLLKDEDGNAFELREAPLRVVSLWVKQLSSDIKQAEKELDQYVKNTVVKIGGIKKLLKAFRALERLFRKWINQERSKDREESVLHFGNFLSETGRMNPLKGAPRDDEGELEGRFDDVTGEIYPSAH